MGRSPRLGPYLFFVTYRFVSKVSDDSRLESFTHAKSFLSDVVGFPDVIGQVPDGFQLFDCAEAEEPLRAILTPNDNWVYPWNSTSCPVEVPRVI